MKRFFMLFKLEYDGVFLPLCAIATVMTILQLGLFSRRLRDTEGHAPLSILIDVGWIPIVFVIAFVCLIILVAARLAMNYSPSKSIYALLTLPVKRGHVYLAKLASSLLAGFMLVTMQMVLVLIFNAIAGMRDASAHGGFEIARRHADLYLSLLDSFFLRMLFPPDLFSLAFAIVGLGGSICNALYGATAAMANASERRNSIIVTIIWMAILLFTFPVTNNSRFLNMVMLIAMLVISIASSVKGIKLFEKGKVAG